MYQTQVLYVYEGVNTSITRDVLNGRGRRSIRQEMHAGHQENLKYLNLYLIVLFLLDFKISKISKIRDETY